VAVDLDAPDGVPPLPAAVEVAAYRLVTIFAKLQVADRNQAIIVARDAGLGRTG
jgi:hypothetical protein